jgi:ATP-binding cassette subfamily B protein
MKFTKNSGNLKSFGKYFKPYIPIILLDLFFAALSTVCELVLPMIVRHITNVAELGDGVLLLSTVLKLGLLYLFLRLVDTYACYFMSYQGHVVGVKIESDMRRDMFSHLMKLSFNYYDNAKVGQIMSRISNDLFDITEFAHHGPEEIFICSIKIIGSFIILSSVNFWLTLIIFAILPIMMLSVIFFRKGMKNAFKKQREQIGELNSQVEDCLLGIRVVKSFANEEKEEEKFQKGNMDFYHSKKNAYVYMARFHSSTRFFDGIMYVAVLIAGSLFMVYEKINAADLIAYFLYIQTLIASIRRLVEFTEQFQRGITGIERFNEIMNETPDICDSENAIDIKSLEGDISFKDVTFAYSDDDTEVLSHINIDVKKGDNIAIVGPSGGGKTTLCNLIPRFYDLTEGDITIDGTSVKDISLKSLRNNIGVVQQDVYLFSGTVKENISLGKPDATDEEIINAAKAAHAHSFIKRLPQGYDTLISDELGGLSQGQKQLICISRIMLSIPPMLILDEATSSIDTRTEEKIQNAFASLMKGRTSFIVAHRLSTIKEADTILVMNKGNIVEMGTHEELLSEKGFYYSLYNSQFSEVHD